MRLACTGRQSSRHARRKSAMFDLIIQHARLGDGPGHPSVLGRRASRTAASQRAGCEFSGMQLLLVWAKVEGKRVIRRRCTRKHAAPCMAQRRLGMRLLAMVFGPHAPDTQTARLPLMLLQWLAEMSKTRNQFYHMRASLCQSHAR